MSCGLPAKTLDSPKGKLYKETSMNLLKETIECIKESGHTVNQIVFIGSEKSGHSCTWEEFEILANKEYDNGYGRQKVAKDLIIVFSDGQKMWRGEYDGSEWWEFSTPFKMPETKKPIKNLFSEFGCYSLEPLNEESE